MPEITPQIDRSSPLSFENIRTKCMNMGIIVSEKDFEKNPTKYILIAQQYTHSVLIYLSLNRQKLQQLYQFHRQNLNLSNEEAFQKSRNLLEEEAKQKILNHEFIVKKTVRIKNENNNIGLKNLSPIERVNKIKDQISEWKDVSTKYAVFGDIPTQKLLSSAYFFHFQSLLKKLGLSQADSKHLRKLLKNYNGSLNMFLDDYKKVLKEKEMSTPLSKNDALYCLFGIKKQKKSSDNTSFFKPLYKRFNLTPKFHFYWLKSVWHDAKIKKQNISYSYLNFMKRNILKFALISFPVLSLSGLKKISTDVQIPVVKQDTITYTVSSKQAEKKLIKLSQRQYQQLNNCQSNVVFDTTQFKNYSQINSSNKTSNSNTEQTAFQKKEIYASQLEQQKKDDLAEFANLYKQCCHDNFIGLQNNKHQVFYRANRVLKQYGLSSLSSGYYCAGMSMASFCQATALFNEKNPRSPVGMALNEMLKNCRNVHLCNTLKADIEQLTHGVIYSKYLEKDIKNYMKTNDNAVVFCWAPRGNGRFHHQNFFNSDNKSNDDYTYCAFNRQHWGNQKTFANYMSSRSKHGRGGYYTDITAGISKMADKYIQKEVNAYYLTVLNETTQTQNKNIFAFIPSLRNRYLSN